MSFAQIEHLPGELSVGETHPVLKQAASIVAGLAFGVSDGVQLALLWRKACALGVANQWIALLHAQQRRTLAAALGDELSAAAPTLHWHTDLELDAFATGEEREPGRTAFASRLDEIFWAQFILAQTRRAMPPADVFAEMASAVAFAGNSTQIGNLLQQLPPGRAYFAAIETLRTARPWSIASLLWHPAFAADGMVAIADWPNARTVQGEGRMMMADEWFEVVRLSRKLAIHESAPDYDAVLALAAHDEAQDSVPPRNPYGRAPVPPLASRLDPLSERLAVAGHAAQVVHAAKRRLDTQPNDIDFALALRVVGLLDKSHPEEAKLLAAAFAEAYARSFSLRAPGRKWAPVLTAQAELLTVLDRVLRDMPDAQRAWTSPFDIDELVEQAKTPVPHPISGNVSAPRFDVPPLIYAHANHLVATAVKATASRQLELIEVAVQLFERTIGRLDIDPWSWRDQVVGADALPFMVRCGEALRLLPEDRANAFAERMVDAGATELHLAQLLWGVGRQSPLRKGLEDRAFRRAEGLLTSGASLALGHANAVAAALYSAGMPALAERFALHVLETTKGRPAHLFAVVRQPAFRVLLAAWMAQAKWDEISVAEFNDSADQAFAENVRALADLERGKVDDALSRLERLLQRYPKDTMALVNTAALHASRKDWAASIAACNRAREALGDAAPPEVSVNEAFAEYNLQNFSGAAAALDRLPPESARTVELIKLRVALATATSPAVSRLEDDLRELAVTDGATADALRARLAPLFAAELGGAWFASAGVERKFHTFEERCAGLSEEPESLLIRAIAGAGYRLAEHPVLVEELNEDQLTMIVCKMLITLERLRVYANVLAPGGYGPQKEGIADFAVSEISERGFTHGRRIVSGEAKFWDGPAWMIKGMKQIFATANTGQEVFLSLVIYSRGVRFETAVAGVRETLATFGSDRATPFSTVAPPEELQTSGTSVRTFRTQHRASDDPASAARTLVTFVIDLTSEPSRDIRRS